MLAVAAAVVVSGCGGKGAATVARYGDDAGRAAARVVVGEEDQLDDAVKFGRRLTPVLTDTAIAPSARTAVDNAARSVPAESPEVSEALRAASWSVFCDVVFGGLPNTRAELADWVSSKALVFGVEFVDEVWPGYIADAIEAAVDDGDSNDNVAACEDMPDSGF